MLPIVLLKCQAKEKKSEQRAESDQRADNFQN
jgi:hypothetical protein